MSSRGPRFVRSLIAAAASTGSVSSCAQYVQPLGDAATDAQEMCPANQPAEGTACATPGLSCTFGSCVRGSSERCDCARDAGAAVWTCRISCIAGPMMPPEMTG